MALSKLWIGNASGSGTTLASSSFNSTGYDAVVLAVKWEGADTTLSVDDNKGSGTYNTLTKVNHSNGDLNLQAFWKHIGTPGTGHVVTVTFSASRSFLGLGLWLVNSSTGSTIALDVESVAQGSGSTHDAGTLSTSAAAALFFAGGGYSLHDHTAGSGWTLDAEGEAAEYLAYQSRLEAASGTFDPVATSTSSSDWVAVSLATKEPGGGGGGGGTTFHLIPESIAFQPLTGIR